jgi:hypothetical protein
MHKSTNAGQARKDADSGSIVYEPEVLAAVCYSKEPAFECGAGEGTVHDPIVWKENTLVRSGVFSLPGRKALLEDNEIKVVLADVTERPVERPKKTAEMVFGHKETTYRKDTANRQPRDGCNLMYGPCGRENP